MTDVKTLGRNEPCHCGSGKKYKQCHLAKDEQAAREARQQAQADAPAAPAEESEAKAPARAAQPRTPRPTPQPWKRSGQNTRGFAKVSATRKVGGGA